MLTLRQLLMIPYQKERIENAILFFALKHKEQTGRDMHQTYAYKYLAFMEFWSLREYGVPAFGLSYLALERGPVPKEIYRDKEFRNTSSYYFHYEGDAKEVIITTKRKANLDFFSSAEEKFMRDLVRKMTDKRTKEFSDESHRQILAWRKAWDQSRARNQVFPFEWEFDDNLEQKENPTEAENHFLLQKALQA